MIDTEPFIESRFLEMLMKSIYSACNTHPVSYAATPLFRGEDGKSPLKRGDLGVCYKLR